MESKVLTFVVVAPNSLAQRGRFLAVGETLQMEEHVARQEFAGRLAYEDGRVVPPWRPPTDLELLVESLPTRRAHERVDLLARHRADILLAELMTEEEHAAAVAAATLEAGLDQARHTERDELRAAVAGTSETMREVLEANAAAAAADFDQGLANVKKALGDEDVLFRG